MPTTLNNTGIIFPDSTTQTSAVAGSGVVSVTYLISTNTPYSSGTMSLSLMGQMEATYFEVGMKVLFTGQSDPSQNGLYTVNNVDLGTFIVSLTRTTGYETTAPFANGVFKITDGTTNGGTIWTTQLMSGAIVFSNILASVVSGQVQTELFTAPGTWTNPGTVTRVKVTVVGGGGGGSTSDGPAPSGPGGVGGVAIAEFTIPTSPVSITVGSGGSGAGPSPGAGGGSGSTSSFGPYISATGGGGAPTGQPSPAGPSGTGSISAPIIPGALRSTDLNTISGGLGFVTGSTVRGSPASPAGTAAIAFAYNNSSSAGAGGGSVSQPFPGPTRFSAGGVNGVVVVEFVG